MSAPSTVVGVHFDLSGTSTAGWNVTADAGVAVTLTGTGSSINNGSTALRSYAVAAGSSGNTVTFAPNIILSPTSGTNQMFSTANDSDSPLFRVTGDISEAVAGVNLNIAGGGGNNSKLLVLSGTNSFTGDFIASARAAVTSIGNKGESSAAGAGNRIVLGKSLTTGILLEYQGGAKTTDRDFHLGSTSGGTDRAFNHAGTGLLKFDGTVTADADKSYTVILRSTNALGTLEFADGFENYGVGVKTTITVRNNLGTVILSGANTFGENTAGGDLVVGINATNAGGTVLINGSTGANANVVVAVGTLGGTGDGVTTGLIGGPVTIGNGGAARDSFLAPGNSIGQLTAASVNFNTDGQLNIELNDVGAGNSDGTTDRLNVMGELNITNAAVDFAATGTLNDTAYIFATYGTLTGATFAAVTNLPSGYEIDYNYGGTNDTIALVIPEPASLGVLTMAGLGLLRRRRAC
jgi:hypothetical protein